MISCGIAYNGDNEKKQINWERIVNCSVWINETSPTPLEMMRVWNHQIHQWLKHYVQSRINAPGERVGLKATFGTFMVSAFWHGFYPFYYFMFV
jgi:lysophospholipid acyltransferase